MAAGPLILAAAAAKAAGSAFQGVQGFMQGKSDAQIYTNEGEQARMDAGVQAQEVLEQGDRLTGQGIAAAAAQGGGTDGSARAVLEDLGRQNLYEARRVAQGGVAQVNAARYQAAVARKQGLFKLIGGGLSAGSTILSGAMQAASLSGSGGGNSGQQVSDVHEDMGDD